MAQVLAGLFIPEHLLVETTRKLIRARLHMLSEESQKIMVRGAEDMLENGSGLLGHDGLTVLMRRECRTSAGY